MICLIPARSGSVRIPNKNRKLFHGKPIIAYSIELALTSSLFSRVVVSTDSPDIADIASFYGASIHARSAELSENAIGTQEVAQDAFTLLEPTDTYSCVLYPCAPLLLASDLEKGLQTLKNWPDMDYSYSTDDFGIDAGNYYFGKTTAFIYGRPLDGRSVIVPLPEERVCDINTIEDWDRAEEMYEANRSKS